jgi:hypothetical protein
MFRRMLPLGGRREQDMQIILYVFLANVVFPDSGPEGLVKKVYVTLCFDGQAISLAYFLGFLRIWQRVLVFA